MGGGGSDGLCDITLYHDKNYGGGSQKFTSTKGDLNTGFVTVGRNDASSYKVNADESCLITGWTHPGLSADGRSRGRYLRGNEPNFNWRRKWNDNNWNDDLDGVAIQTIPSANSNQMQYHIAIDHYTPHSFNDTYCGGCRWWPEVKNRGDYKNADRDDVMVREGVTFRPCPGGRGYFNSKSGVRCIYSKTDPNGLKNLFSNKNGIQNDPRASMHAELKNQFCKVPDNIFKNPGGGSCFESEEGKSIAKEYCSVGNRMATDGNCTKDNLGNFYSEVAETYCKTASGKADAWCSCYNVTTKVCDTDPAAAGCSDKRQNYDKLVDSTPQDYKNSWSDMEPCFGGVCIGNKYRPDGYDNNCSKSVNICDFNFDFQSMADSAINASCNIGNGEGGRSTPSYPPGSLSEKLDSNFRSKLPESIQQFIPVSVGELGADSNKLLGVGGSVFSSVICVILIIVLSLSGGGGSARFRR